MPFHGTPRIKSRPVYQPAGLLARVKQHSRCPAPALQTPAFPSSVCSDAPGTRKGADSRSPPQAVRAGPRGRRLPGIPRRRGTARSGRRRPGCPQPGCPQPCSGRRHPHPPPRPCGRRGRACAVPAAETGRRRGRAPGAASCGPVSFVCPLFGAKTEESKGSWRPWELWDPCLHSPTHTSVGLCPSSCLVRVTRGRILQPVPSRPEALWQAGRARGNRGALETNMP